MDKEVAALLQQYEESGRDVNKAGSFKAKAKSLKAKAKAKAKSLKAKAKSKARSLKAKTKAKARDQG